MAYCKSTEYYTNSNIMIILNLFSDKPTVTHFTTGNAENSAVIGRDVTLTCSANGFPIPQYIIKRNKTEVIRNAPGTFVVRNVQLSAESDTYSCEPFNDQGRGPIKELKIAVYGEYQGFL